MSQPHGSEPVTLTQPSSAGRPPCRRRSPRRVWRNAWRVVLTIHGRSRLRPCDHNGHRGSGFLKLSGCDLWADHCTCGTWRRLLHDYQGVNPPASARAGAAPTFLPMNRPMNRGTDRRSGASGRSVSGCPSIGSTSEPATGGPQGGGGYRCVSQPRVRSVGSGGKGGNGTRSGWAYVLRERSSSTPRDHDSSAGRETRT